VGIVTDILIRATGMLGVLASVAMFAWLYRLSHAAPTADPSLGDYLLAAMAFLGFSVGSGSLLLGRHVNDRIEVAERWRRRI